MLDALSSSAAAIRTSAGQFDKAAQRVVKSAAGGDDLAAAVVDTKQSEISFRADIAAFKTADEMMGTLLDTIV